MDKWVIVRPSVRRMTWGGPGAGHFPQGIRQAGSRDTMQRRCHSGKRLLQPTVSVDAAVGHVQSCLSVAFRRTR